MMIEDIIEIVEHAKRRCWDNRNVLGKIIYLPKFIFWSTFMVGIFVFIEFIAWIPTYVTEFFDYLDKKTYKG